MKFSRALMLSLAVLAAHSVVDLSMANAAPLAASAANFRVVETINLPDSGPNGFWDYAAIDGGTRTLLLGTETGVMAVDLDSRKITPQLVPGALVHIALPLPHGLAVSTNGSTRTVTLFEVTTGRQVASIPAGHHPDAAAFDEKSGLVFVTDVLGNEATLVDPTAQTSPGRIDLGSSPEFVAGDGQGKMYVNMAERNAVAVVDLAARKVSGSFPLPGCSGPTGIAIDRATGTLAVSCENRTAILLRASDGMILGRVKIGAGADAVIFDPIGQRFFIPCGEDGTLVVISERSPTGPAVTAVIKTAIGARTGAIDPKTGLVYLPTADLGGGTFKVEGHAVPKHRPGTFRLLVIGPG
jgi:DNA-binding beta-propeller fold protein YncE